MKWKGQISVGVWTVPRTNQKQFASLGAHQLNRRPDTRGLGVAEHHPRTRSSCTCSTTSKSCVLPRRVSCSRRQRSRASRTLFLFPRGSGESLQSTGIAVPVIGYNHALTKCGDGERSIPKCTLHVATAAPFALKLAAEIEHEHTTAPSGNEDLVRGKCDCQCPDCTTWSRQSPSVVVHMFVLADLHHMTVVYREWSLFAPRKICCRSSLTSAKSKFQCFDFELAPTQQTNITVFKMNTVRPKPYSAFPALQLGVTSVKSRIAPSTYHTNWKNKQDK